MYRPTLKTHEMVALIRRLDNCPTIAAHIRTAMQALIDSVGGENVFKDVNKAYREKHGLPEK